MNIQQAVWTQLDFWHRTLDDMLADCGDVLHRRVEGETTNTIAATYAHAVMSEDVIVHAMLQDGQPIYLSGGWEAKTGVPFIGMPPGITREWEAAARIDLATFRPYASAVYAATHAYLSALPDADLARTGYPGPFGETTLEWTVCVALGTHFIQHAGEISALKGVFGIKGMPF